MSESANLWLYFLIVSGVIILPGMDMAFVMGSSMAGGRRAGLAAVAGIVAGGVCHMIIAASGLAILLKLVPALYTLLLFGGAAYIGWIGWSLMRAGEIAGPALTTGRRKPVQTFFGAMATCLLNPKAYIFMLAIFPQFVHAERGSIWEQAGILSVITAFTQVAVYGTLAVLTVRIQLAVADRPHFGVWMAKGVGLILIAASLLTVYGGLNKI